MAETHSTPTRVRPGIVTISSYLLILVAVLQVISLIIVLATLGTTRRVFEEAYSGTAADGMDALADFSIVVGVGASLITVLMAVALIVLAVLNNRGKNGSRIATWILGGVLLCCTGGTLLSEGASRVSGPIGGSSADMPSTEEIARRLEEALPSWYTPVTMLINVLTVVALIAALVLLALPASNEFFRKQQPAWEPPVPGAYPGYPSGTPGYPPQGQPGYPPTPGYPPQGQPGYPPTPGYPGQAPSGEPGYPPPSGPGQPGQSGQSGQPDQPGQPPAGGTGGSTGGDQNPPGDRPGPYPPSGS